MKFQMTSADDLSLLKDDQRCSETKDSLTQVVQYLQSIGVGALFSLIVTVSSPLDHPS